MDIQAASSRQKSAIAASAPGSLMLLGEHAVLHGRRALVCAINQRITVEVFQTLEKTLAIRSDLGIYEAPLDDLEDHPDFRFVLDAVQQYPLEQGIEMNITSDFSSDIGFGSSAAVTVAAHAALMKQTNPSAASVGGRVLSNDALFRRSLATIHRVQGRGSGADVAASVYGGVLACQKDEKKKGVSPEKGVSPMISVSGKNTEIIGLTPLAGKNTEIIGLTPLAPLAELPLTAVYSGSKMKTADVIHLVEEQRQADPEKYERIFDAMDVSVGRVLDDPDQLGPEMICNQKLMEEMGLCNRALAEIISIFRRLDVPAKISGSGLGDCAVGLGAFPTVGSFKTFLLQVDAQGVRNG